LAREFDAHDLGRVFEDPERCRQRIGSRREHPALFMTHGTGSRGEKQREPEQLLLGFGSKHPSNELQLPHHPDISVMRAHVVIELGRRDASTTERLDQLDRGGPSRGLIRITSGKQRTGESTRGESHASREVIAGG
jgi:hypothetical protein